MSEIGGNFITDSDDGLKEGQATRPSSSSKSTIIFGIATVLIIFLGLGVWSAVAPLAKAVAAGATLTVKGERKNNTTFGGAE